MARKGRDLFELLEARRQGSTPKKSKRSRRSSGPGWASAITGAVASVLTPSPKGRKSSRSRGGLVIAGHWFALIVVSAIGVGFVLGRGFTPVQAGPDLNMKEDPGAGAPVEQGWLPGGRPAAAPPDMDIHKEVEPLSKYFAPVLLYPDTERERASRLAYYLRSNGIDSARIRLLESTRKGRWLWATVVYVADLTQWDDHRTRLRAVPPPDFEPKFAENVAGELKLLQKT